MRPALLLLPLIAAFSMSTLAQTPATTAKPAPAAKPAAKKAATPPAPPPPPLAAATPEQIDAAERTHFGPYGCEFAQTVDVSMNPKNAGYVDVRDTFRSITAPGSNIFVVKTSLWLPVR